MPMMISTPVVQAADQALSTVQAQPAAAVLQSDQEVERLTQAAVKFEAFFVAQMMKQMRQATAAIADKDSALNDEVNQMPLALADNAVADAMATQRAFGIADVLVRQMVGAMPSADTAALISSRNLS